MENILRSSRQTIELTCVGGRKDEIRHKYQLGINEFALTITKKGKI